MPDQVERLWTDVVRWERAITALRDLPMQPQNADRVAAVWRQIAHEQHDPLRRAEAILNLATALEYGSNDDLQQAIAMSEGALAVLGPEYPEAAAALFGAAQRLVKEGTLNARRRALDHLHSALAVPKKAGGRKVVISILECYASLALDIGDFSRLSKATRIFEGLRKYPLKNQEVSAAYLSIISLYEARWKMEGHRPSLGRAIKLSTEALARYKDGASDAPSDRAALLQKRAILLLARHEHTCVKSDFDAAATLMYEAAEISPQRGEMLNSLAIALMGRGDDDAFVEARSVLEDGLALTSDRSTVAYLAWTMANWHLRAHKQGGPASHLDLAIESIERAAASKDLVGSEVLFTVAHAYYDRYRLTRAEADIDRSIEAAELGLSLTHEKNSSRWSQEVTTANSYIERSLYGRFGFDAADANRASTLYQRAIGRIPKNSVHREVLASTAMGALIERYAEAPDARLLDAALSYARILPERPDAAMRLDDQAAANLAIFHLEHGSSQENSEAWLSLLLKIAQENAGNEIGWIAASNLMHRNMGSNWAAVLEVYEILKAQRTSRLAAAQSVRERAMVLRREQSVAGLAGLALLHLGRPDAAARLIDDSQAALLLDQCDCAIDKEHVWNVFGAVLYPVWTRYGAYTLVATSSGVTGVLVSNAEFQFSDRPAPPDAADLKAAAVMLSAAFPEKLPPRLLVVPSGYLSGIPWAAVTYGSGKLVDVSTITVLPTLKMLAEKEALDHAAVLIVDAADALPGSLLRHAAAESCQIRAWMRRGRDLRGAGLTRDVLLDALPTSTVAHFACHSIVDNDDPLNSRMILSGDESLSVSDILGVNCSGLSLVVLSACQSAVHGHELADEFASVGVAFLSAGARTVVGTLWNVNDATASLFSRRLFEAIKGGAAPSKAVQLAQKWLRDTTNGEIADWLAQLGPATGDAERGLRRSLENSADIIGFGDIRHWGAFVCYG